MAKEQPPFFKGRTDMLLCGGIEDIKRAQLILSLLVHARYNKIPLAYQELGNQFIKEVKELLEVEKVLNWLDKDNKFVDLKNKEEINNLGNVLLAISNLRSKVNKMIKEYNEQCHELENGLKFYEEEKSDPKYKYNEDYLNSIRKNLAKLSEEIVLLRQEIDSSLPSCMKKLIEKYFSLVYPQGRYINELNIAKRSDDEK